MLNPLGPAHFRNVDQTFDTFFQLNKCAVVGQADYLTGHLVSNGIFATDIQPRIRRNLLESQRDTFFFAIKLKNLNINFVTNRQNI